MRGKVKERPVAGRTPIFGVIYFILFLNYKDSIKIPNNQKLRKHRPDQNKAESDSNKMFTNKRSINKVRERGLYPSHKYNKSKNVCSA